jgi:hypothetical protein
MRSEYVRVSSKRTFLAMRTIAHALVPPMKPPRSNGQEHTRGLSIKGRSRNRETWDRGFTSASLQATEAKRRRHIETNSTKGVDRRSEATSLRRVGRRLTDAASQTEKLMASSEFEFGRAANRAKQAQRSTCRAVA